MFKQVENASRKIGLAIESWYKWILLSFSVGYLNSWKIRKNDQKDTA